MTVRTLLIFGASAFLALLGAAFGTTLLLLGDETGGARNVGLTNRQGMLSQKMAKEALEYARSPTPEALTQLRNTMQVFSVTHRALRLGGSAPLDLEGQTFEYVAGATDAELQRLLKKGSGEWVKIENAIDRLILAAQRRNEALAQVELKNPRLMRKMDEVTRMLAKRPQTRALQVAGYQGIMAERTVKEALLYDAAPDNARRDQLMASIAAFERGHDSLRTGRLRPASGNGRPISARPSAEVAERLDEAKWLWIDQAEALARIAGEDDDYHRTVATINETNPVLLSTLAAAALRADWVAARNVRRLRAVQLTVVTLGLLVAIAATIVAIRIGASLRQLRDTADKISRGNVDRPVQTTGIGEIRDLARSFERMRLSLQKAMELLERRSASGRPGATSRSTIDRR